ncbi:MAG: iron complex outermembrane receptor protein [Gammaproteobacteria bacterium]|jgi:iron complex outermembrane receptor protein
MSRHINTNSNFQIISAILIGLSLSFSSFAQDALEEIIVTAQKREENIQEVPISITQLSGDRLNARFSGGGDILQLASAAPGLHIESSNGRLAPRFYLRGLGNADFTAAASQPVSVVFDEVPMEKSALKAFPIFDMASVEVARGPQGTLFGRNTTAGIVHIKTNRPTEETEGYIRLSGGNLETFNAEAAISGTLIEGKLTGRASFLTQNRGDWVDNGFTGENDAMGGHNIFAGRVQLLWTPTEDFSALFMHQHQDSEATVSLFRANVISQGSNELNSNYSRDKVFFDGGDNNPGNIKSHGSTVKLDWDVGDYTITSVTSYQDVYDRFGRGDIDGGFGCLFACGGIPSGPASTPFSPFNSPFVVDIDTGGGQDIEQWTQEIRVASNLDGPLNYQFGAFYFDDKIISDSGNRTTQLFVPAFFTNSSVTIENTSWAIFGQGSYDITEELTLTAGLRYTDDEKDADHIDFTGAVVTVPINVSDDHLGFDVALAYAWNDSTQVYARIASGFRAPTIQDRIQDDPSVTIADTETIMSYEIGIKGQSDRFRYSLSGFYYDIDDMQLVVVGGAANTTTLVNAQQGTGIGVEFEMDYLVTDNLILSGGFGYADTEIKDPNLAVQPGPLVTVLDPTIVNAGATLALIDGNRFQHAPLWTANFELDYTYPFGENTELYLFTDWKLKGKTQDFLYESVEYTFGTQFEGGLRMGYRNTAKNYEFGFFARNITDEDNLIGGIDFANNTGYVNEPRVWGGEFSYSF